LLCPFHRAKFTISPCDLRDGASGFRRRLLGHLLTTNRRSIIIYIKEHRNISLISSKIEKAE
ncbi:MAG: hypothetical protein IKK12_07045, partial [Clostridia bacterium]|nr:hypothetical protein [Clostridia bacterium]